MNMKRDAEDEVERDAKYFVKHNTKNVTLKVTPYHRFFADGAEGSDEQLASDLSRLPELVCWRGPAIVRLQEVVDDLKVRKSVFVTWFCLLLWRR